MGQTKALTAEQLAKIWDGRQSGRTLRPLADELGCSPETVRKWARHFRDHGRAGGCAPFRPRS